MERLAVGLLRSSGSYATSILISFGFRLHLGKSHGQDTIAVAGAHLLGLHRVRDLGYPLETARARAGL